jgi:hypothetical protein
LIGRRRPSGSVFETWSAGRAGIEPKALQLGEQVTLRTHPLNGGQPGGWLIDVTKADGAVLDPDDDN